MAYLRKLKLVELGFSMADIKEMSVKEREVWLYISDCIARKKAKISMEARWKYG